MADTRTVTLNRRERPVGTNTHDNETAFISGVRDQPVPHGPSRFDERP
jgi:hypothetical protein